MPSLGRSLAVLRMPLVGPLVRFWTANRDAIALLYAHGPAAVVAAFRELGEDSRTLLRDGGLTIQTPAQVAEGQPFDARLLVQLDGDIVHSVRAEVLHDRAAQSAHRARIEAVLRDWRRRVELVSAALTLALGVPVLTIGLATSVSAWLAQSWWVLAGGAVLAAVAPLLAGQALKAALRRAIGRAL